MRGLFILLALLTSSCISNSCISRYGNTPHGSVVTIRQPNTIASGVVIGKNLIVTAAHCVNKDGYIKVKVSRNSIIKYTEFYKLTEINSKPENMICIYGDYNFRDSAIFEIGFGSSPAFVQTSRGLFEIDEFNPQPGDSGSALIDRRGRLIGLVYGRKTIKGKKAPVFLLFKEEK
jgi:V8-like Glu-specific endopeptidase